MLPLDRSFQHQGQSVAWGRIGEGPPLVLIHGFPWSAQAWRRIAPWLAERRTVYYFDMLGCGRSEKFAGQDVAPAVQNELLAALLDHWSLDRPDVVGHDFGGLAALRGHFVSGLAYRSLTLIDSVAVLPSGSPFYAHAREHEDALAGLPGFAHDALLHAYIRYATWRPLPEDVIEMYAEPWRGEDGQPAFYRQIAQSDLQAIAELQELYRPLDGPVQLIWGEHDANIPVSQGKQLAELLQADRFTRVPDAAHLVLEDAPEAVVAALLSGL